MKTIKKVLWILLLSAFPLSGWAQLGFSVQDTTGVEGDTILINVLADSSLTGEDIFSFQFNYFFARFSLDILDVETEGTLTEGVATVEGFQTNTDEYRVAGFSTNALSGSGILFKLRVRLRAASSFGDIRFSGGTARNFVNEGSPEIITSNGRIVVQERPQIFVSPLNNITLTTVGDSLQYRVTTSTPDPPYAYSVTDTALADIDTTGRLVAKKPGFVFVVAEGANGSIDSTDVPLEIRAFKTLPYSDQVFQKNRITVPVRVSDLSNLNATAGEFDFRIGSSSLQWVGYDVTNTLLEQAQVDVNVTDRNGTFSFATDQPLAQGDTLIKMEFIADSSLSGNNVLIIDRALLNEDIKGTTTDFIRINVVRLPQITVSVDRTEVLAGDTVRATATNTTGPVTWSVTDTVAARIDQAGTMIAQRNGTVRVSAVDSILASGLSNNVRIYDIGLQPVSVTIQEGDTALVPVRVSNMNAERGIASIQATVSIDNTYLDFHGIVAQGSDAPDFVYSWRRISNDNYLIAGAGDDSLQTDGTLFFLKVSAKTLILNTRNVVISFQQNTILLNEGFPVPLLSTGTARVTRLPLGIELLLPANDSTDAPGSVRFVWKANSIATAYDLQVSRGSNSFTSPIVVENLADTAHVLDNLEFSSTYFWRVRGKNSFGNGDWSAPFRFSTLVPPNTPPYNEVRIGERTRTEDFPTFIASKVDTVFFDNDTGDSLSFTLQSTPNHVVARLNGPNLEIESLPDAFGRDSIIVRATDRGGLFVQDTLFMNVLPLNDEPRITDDLPDTLRIRNDSTLVLDMFFLVFDPDHPTDSLTLTVGSSASQVNVAVGDSLKTTITAPGFVGQSNLLFTLTDPLGASGVKNVVLIVTDSSTPNLPPVITNDLPDTLNMRVDETFAVDMFFIVFDPDHPTDSLELKVTTPVSGLNITVGDSLETTITSSGFTGNAQLTFTLTDPEGASDTRIVTLIVAGTTSTEWTRNLPEQLELRQNYPNPFNPSTTIGFGIPESAHVRVEVYNMLGQQVEVLVNQRMSAGWHTLIFDASRLSSGMYVYRVVSGAQVQTRKMVLVK